MKTVAAACIAIFLAASAAPAQTAPAPAAADFAVATYNINYANADLDAVARTIRGCGADLVALQETNRRSEAFLRKALADVYPHMVFHHAADAAGGFAMLSKVPFDKPRYAPRAPGAGGVFGTESARVALAGREMLVVNVHLMPTVPPRNTNAAGLMALFAKTDAIRDREIRAIVGGLPRRWPVLILGDFNSPPTLSGVPAFLAASAFTDCLAKVLKDADGTPTWHSDLAGVNYGGRLDYIFSARLGATPARGAVVPGEGSDHFLVTCAFSRTPLPVAAGKARTEAVNVVYVPDAPGPDGDRAAAARELVTTSMSALTDGQNFCVVVPGRATVVPTELTPAVDAPRALAAEALKRQAEATRDELLAAARRGADLLEDEAAPKALVIVSDRAAKDPALLKSLSLLAPGRRLQVLVLDAEGKPITGTAE